MAGIFYWEQKDNCHITEQMLPSLNCTLRLRVIPPLLSSSSLSLKVCLLLFFCFNCHHFGVIPALVVCSHAPLLVLFNTGWIMCERMQSFFNQSKQCVFLKYKTAALSSKAKNYYESLQWRRSFLEQCKKAIFTRAFRKPKVSTNKIHANQASK